MNKSGDFPYRTLGATLRGQRVKLRQSLAEVSGAVEIDTNELAAIEAGKLCPTEDILLLLISHFGLTEHEATKLWELADYTDADYDIGANHRPTASPNDLRILYTDLVHVMVSKYGVVINFMQASPPGSRNLLISRVGMSKEHAETLMKVLQDTLVKSNEPKQLKDKF